MFNLTTHFLPKFKIPIPHNGELTFGIPLNHKHYPTLLSFENSTVECEP